MTDAHSRDNDPSADDMSGYLQMFLDETEEQLDDLVESLLVLENAPENPAELNEAFRLIHSIKGAAGMLALESITVLTHHLENRFEQFRSGAGHLDQPTMNVVLKCIDFLRECNARLRGGSPLGSPAELLEELRSLEDRDEPVALPEASTAEPSATHTPLAAAPPAGESATPVELPIGDDMLRLTVQFEPGLLLADLKARLILTRLAALGQIEATAPPRDELESAEELSRFEVLLTSDRAADELREAADVDGVQEVEIGEASAPPPTQGPSPTPPTEITPQTATSSGEGPTPAEPAKAADEEPAAEEPANEGVRGERLAVEQVEPSPALPPAAPPPAARPAPPVASDGGAKVSETMRVDIERLDHLMNLAGQLVINRARFVQLSEQLSPALRKTQEISGVRELVDSLRRWLEQGPPSHDNGQATAGELAEGLSLLEHHLLVWDDSRRHMNQVNEAIDQLTRVSDSLQRAVMQTRMVPVAPLFNRFNRVVRDLSLDRDKQVRLELHGEKTELDKRMIDQLGDPMMHLVRNCVDHGLERSEVRSQAGKPAEGVIRLSASHEGNNIVIQVSDDGAGVDAEKLRRKVVERGWLDAATADSLPDDQLTEYIWHPGLSTASEITDVSGRGVGMDVVKTRVSALNGTIDVRSVRGEGCTFTIRLPLTLAIINSLLVRAHDVVFAIPMDDVREIVSVPSEELVTVRGKQTCAVRGEYLPLVQVEEVFQWREISGPAPDRSAEPALLDMVILHAGKKRLGLRVDELLGSQDIVIKSLADNLAHLRGLSGASILGDGRVCLMLDVAAVLDMVFHPGEIER